MAFIQKPVFYFLEGGLLGMYRFEKYKTDGKREKGKKEISSVTIIDDDKGFDADELLNIASAACLARDLINTPANDLTPTALAKLAVSMKGKGVKVKILERRDIEKEGMGALSLGDKGF